jgi:hypothetical protein
LLNSLKTFENSTISFEARADDAVYLATFLVSERSRLLEHLERKTRYSAARAGETGSNRNDRSSCVTLELMGWDSGAVSLKL